MDLTKAKTFDIALDTLFKDYMRYKLYFLKSENNRYEIKWGMSFEEFEEKSPNMKNGMSNETEQEYYQWEAVMTELEYFRTRMQQWM